MTPTPTELLDATFVEIARGPIHQPREHAVPCQRCQHDTWSYTAICDPCSTSAKLVSAHEAMGILVKRGWSTLGATRYIATLNLYVATRARSTLDRPKVFSYLFNAQLAEWDRAAGTVK